jgi:hypothetical protein
MKALTFNSWKKTILLDLICWLGISFFLATGALGELTSGVTLTLHADTENHPELYYQLGDPVKLIMVIKNESQWPINTERGFSQTELHKALVLTDPNGVTHALSAAGTQVFDPLPALSIDNRPTAKAESLPGGWVRSITIDDLRTFFPMMNSTPGWYEIVAHQFFVRFTWAFNVNPMGLLAFQDEQANNWYGTVDSNTLRLYIAPPSGAQLQTQVLDNSYQPPQPINQVLVRVFRKIDLPADYTPAVSWSKTPYVLQGKSNPEGWVVWESASDVQCLPEDAYVVMASYADGYGESVIPTGAAAGWTPGCQDAITTQLVFGEQATTREIGDFSVFALNSVYVRSKAVIYDGNIGVQSASEGPWLNSQVEISIGSKAEAKAGCQIFGDSIVIGNKAKVFDVFYNELNNKGTILGEEHTPLELPVASEPVFGESTPGAEEVTVKVWRTRVLTPGNYGDIIVRAKGKLILTGGEYHFRSLYAGLITRLECENRSTIFVQNRVRFLYGAYLGPAKRAPIGAADIIFYVGGTNGKNGSLYARPKAADIGSRAIIKANMYAPRGTLSIGSKADVEGSFVAKDVEIGTKATVRHNSTDWH